MVIHPQSVVHSMVEFVDGSLKAQLGRPDMRLPIAVALGYPDRLPDAVPPTVLEELDGARLSRPRRGAFPERRPGPARRRREGGGRPAVLNAANEEAVNAFLAGAIPFSGIVRTVERALEAFPGAGESLQEILEADRWAREYVKVNSGRLKT